MTILSLFKMSNSRGTITFWQTEMLSPNVSLMSNWLQTDALYWIESVPNHAKQAAIQCRQSILFQTRLKVLEKCRNGSWARRRSLTVNKRIERHILSEKILFCRFAFVAIAQNVFFSTKEVRISQDILSIFEVGRQLVLWFLCSTARSVSW